MTDINSLASRSNVRASIPGTTQYPVGSAAFVTLVEQLFGSKGPLSSYNVRGMEFGPEGFVISVSGAWRPQVAQAITAKIKEYAAKDINTQGWNFTVTDVTNEEGVQPQR